MSPIKLYDLAGADASLRFSPFCWRTRMALAHKGLPVDTIAWRFSDKDAIAFSGQGRVPVLVDGERTVFDSWTIAEYLDETYGDRPLLLGDESAAALTRFVNAWTNGVIHPALAPLVLSDIYACIDDGDKAYFRSTREKVFGKALEDVSANRNTDVLAFRRSLEPLRVTLQAQSFIAGATPAYADYIVFGAFQWARCVSPFRLLEDNDPVAAWRQRLLEAFDGLAARAPGHAV